MCDRAENMSKGRAAVLIYPGSSSKLEVSGGRLRSLGTLGPHFIVMTLAWDVSACCWLRVDVVELHG